MPTNLPSILSGAGQIAQGIGNVAGLFSGGPDTTMQQHGLDFAKHQFSVQQNFQNKLAREGVSMRMADIMRASKESGLHPSQIMGLQPYQGGAGSVGTPHFDAQDSKGTRQAKALRQMGQDISRAARQNETLDQKRKKAEIALIEAQTNSIQGQGGRANTDQDAPSKPIGAENVVPSRVESTLTEAKTVAAGQNPSRQYHWSGDKLMVLPSKEATEALESSPARVMTWEADAYMNPQVKSIVKAAEKKYGKEHRTARS